MNFMWFCVLLVCLARHFHPTKCTDEMDNFPLDTDDELKNDAAQSTADETNIDGSTSIHDKLDLSGLTSSGGGQVKLFNQLMSMAMKKPGAKQKLAQVMPIIRAMSPTQRLTLATLVLKQVMSKSVKSRFELPDKVDKESSELMIPISLDIASIFNPAAKDSESGRSSVFGTYYYHPLSTGYRVNGPPPARPPPVYNIRRYQLQNTRRKGDIPPEMMPPPYVPTINSSYANFNKQPATHATDEDKANGSDEDDLDTTDGDDVKAIASEVSSNKDCVPYVDNMCLDVRSYPNKDILNSIRNLEQKHVFRALVEDFSRNVTIDAPEMERRDGQEETDNYHICATKVKYARPKKAKSMHGNWKFVVNTERYTQTVRIETCLNADKACSYLTDNVKSHCTQIYNYHRLLTWDEKSGLSLDLFKIPTCCACQIQQVTAFTNQKKHFKPDSSIQDNVIVDEASMFHSTISKPKPKAKPNGPLFPNRDYGRPRRPPLPILPVHAESNERILPAQPPNRYSPNDNSIRRASHKSTSPKGIFVQGKGTMVENAEVENTSSSHRVNYNYHPIIDFFNPAQKEPNIDRADAIDDWLPITEGPRSLS